MSKSLKNFVTIKVGVKPTSCNLLVVWNKFWSYTLTLDVLNENMFHF